MQRQVCWHDRLEDGTKREIRVTIQQGKVKWQFKRAADERWDYTTPPSAADWDTLMSKVEDRYQRRSAAFDDVELVRNLRQRASAESAGGPTSVSADERRGPDGAGPSGKLS